MIERSEIPEQSGGTNPLMGLVPRSRMYCIYCSSRMLRKAGWKKLADGRRFHRYECTKCGKYSFVRVCEVCGNSGDLVAVDLCPSCIAELKTRKEDG